MKMFFSTLWMTDNNLSVCPHQHRVQLFDSSPNRIDFNSRWVMVESKICFPFHLIGEKEKWGKVARDVLLTPTETCFLSIVAMDLGFDPRE